MVTKQKHFLDSLRQMVSKTEDITCPACQKVYQGDFCPNCQSDNGDGMQDTSTAYLVDLVSNHKIRIPTPACKVGRDEANDIVVSGDQSISRHHLTIINENNQYYIDDNDSRHGTFLNGSQIKTREVINDGDVVKIGVSLFWFVIETAELDNDETGPTVDSASQSPNTFEQTHLTVKPDAQTEPSDPSTSTMNEIPAMDNEQSLLERLRLKTRSFDQQGLFAHAQAQPGTIAPQTSSDSSKSLSETQIVLPSLDKTQKIESSDSKETSSIKSPPVTESFAVPQPTNGNANPDDPMPASKLPASPKLVGDSTNYDLLMSADLAELNEKYNALKNKVEEAQREMNKVEGELNSIRAFGTALIGGSASTLLETCNEVLTQLGWQVTPNQNDPQELQLRSNDQLAIARVIWTTEEPERSHLGQLSIAQTQLWCDQGDEPKGILIVSRLSDKDNKIPALTAADYDSELAHYAAKKNVCMLTSLQILAIYRDLILRNADINSLREKITSSNGWLPGFTIKNPD